MHRLAAKITGLRFRHKLLLAALGPLIPCLVAGTIGMRTLHRAVHAHEQTIELTRRLEDRDRLLTLVIDGESALRGFLLSGDERSLAAIDSSRRHLPEVARRLEAQLDREPAQAARVRSIGLLFDDWLREYADPLIAARRRLAGALPQAARADAAAAQALASLLALRSAELTARIRDVLAAFEATERDQAVALLRASERDRKMAVVQSAAALAAACIAGLWMAAVIASRTSRSMSNLIEIATAVARGDLSRRARVKGSDEVAEVARSLNRMVARIDRRASERQHRQELAALLQASTTIDEAGEVVARMAPALLTGGRGALYMLGPSRDLLTSISRFGADSDILADELSPDDCWSIRSGQRYETQDGKQPPCKHQPEAAFRSLCAPLASQGEIFGLFHYELPRPDSLGGESGELMSVAGTLASELSLAFGALRLRATLREQSIRDPLTGLFNRRYFEETFERELQRARRTRRPLTLMMLDLDHFKRFNDTFGHEAGDLVLKEIGAILLSTFRVVDVPCRLGGEEFAVLLPDSEPISVLPRASELAETVRSRELRMRGQILGRVTLSMGLAGFPAEAESARELRHAADRALYESKREGRDRITLATV